MCSVYQHTENLENLDLGTVGHTIGDRFSPKNLNLIILLYFNSFSLVFSVIGVKFTRHHWRNKPVVSTPCKGSSGLQVTLSLEKLST